MERGKIGDRERKEAEGRERNEQREEKQKEAESIPVCHKPIRVGRPYGLGQKLSVQRRREVY